MMGTAGPVSETGQAGGGDRGRTAATGLRRTAGTWLRRAADPSRTAGRALARASRALLDPPLATLLAALIVIFIARYLMAAGQLDMGHDIANYLSTMNTLFGRDASGFGLNRPPLIGLVLKPFAAAFGHLAGAKVLGVLVSVAPGIPFYLLARRLCRPWFAAAGAILFVLTPAYSDLLTWGYLTMFGLLGTMFALHFLLRLLDHPTKANIFLTGASISLIAGFHQLSLLYFVIMLALVLAALAAADRRTLMERIKPLAAAMAVGLLLCLPYLPIYLRLARLQAPAAAGQAAGLTALDQVRADLSFGTDLSTVPWLLFLVIVPAALAAVALKWTWAQDRRSAAALGAVLLYSLVLVVVVLPPPFSELNRRAHYFLYFPLWLLAAFFLSRLWAWAGAHPSTPRLRGPQARASAVTHVRGRIGLPPLPRPRAAMAAIMVAVLLAMTPFLSFRHFHRALEFYRYLDDSRWEAVAWVSSHASGEGSVVAYPETLGWWIEAEAGRNTANVADRDTVPLTYLRERSLLGDRILSGNEGLDNGLLRLATAYPYTGAPGSPAIGVYAGGWYRDVLLFDDALTWVATPAGEDLTLAAGEYRSLAAASREGPATTGDTGAMTLACSYRLDGQTVLQTARLERGSRTAAIRYQFSSATAAVRLALLYAFPPEAVTVTGEGHSVEVVQPLPGVAGPVTTRIDVDARGAVLEAANAAEGLELRFASLLPGAEISLSITVTGPGTAAAADVTAYSVPRLIEDPSLEHLPAAAYLAVDLAPASCAGAALPASVEAWLGACPYYELVYAQEDIRIYRVDRSALP